MREDRALGEEKSAIGLPHHARRGIEAGVGRISAPKFGGIKDLVRNVVQLGGLERPAEHRPILRPALDAAGGDEEALVRIGLEVVPEFVAAPQERDV